MLLASIVFNYEFVKKFECNSIIHRWKVTKIFVDVYQTHINSMCELLNNMASSINVCHIGTIIVENDNLLKTRKLT